MRPTRLQLYRPTRTSDGEGGWTDTLGEATALYGAVQIHESEIRISHRYGDDLHVEDIIDAGNAYYRIVALVSATEAPWQMAIAERTERPIVP